MRSTRGTRVANALGVVLALLVAARAAGAQGRPPGATRDDPGRLSRTDEDGQPTALPSLPEGMTIATIRAGDALFHDAGGCVRCHAADAIGVPGKGSALTAGLSYIPRPYAWSALDSLGRAGIPERITRANVACPPWRRRGRLTAAQGRQLAAYVWAIAQTRGEPWSGGHATHLSSREQR